MSLAPDPRTLSCRGAHGQLELEPPSGGLPTKGRSWPCRHEPSVGAGCRGGGQGRLGRSLDLRRLLAAWVINLQIPSAPGDCFLSSGTLQPVAPPPTFPEPREIMALQLPQKCLVRAPFYLQPWTLLQGCVLGLGPRSPGPGRETCGSGILGFCDSGTSEFQPCRLLDGETLGDWGDGLASMRCGGAGPAGFCQPLWLLPKILPLWG